jgi:arylsulfatase A-like enzyme
VVCILRTTFATLLGQNGYKTGYSGKWHLDGHGKPQWGPKRQFGFADNRFMFNRGHWKVLEDGPDGPRVKTRKNGKPTYDITGADEKSFTTDWLADKTVEFIKQNKDQPFCYMVSIPDPHGPDTVRAPYNKMYTHMNFETPRTAGKKQKGVPTWAQPKRGGANHAQYFGMVKCIDDNISKMMKALEKCGVLEDTIVIFTSDHGDLRGEHDRQNKGTVLEASAKVPFIVRYPKLIKAGKLIKEAMGGVDFLPTALSLLGVKTNGKEEGRDTAALFTGNTPSGWNDVAIIRGTGNLNWISAISERHKFVISPHDEPWLIDKKKDPDELVNFCNNPEYRSVVKKLAEDLKAYGEKYKDPSLTSKKLAYDVNWALSSTSNYNLEEAPVVPKKAEKAKKKKKKQ